jgi:RND family efflux transporter MFP subunit
VKGNRQRFAVGLAVLVALSCSEVEAPPPPIVRSVLVTEVPSPGTQRKREFAGLSQAHETAELSFRVEGEIAGLYVKRGDQVEEGTLIAELDPTDYELELREARATLGQSKAEAKSAEANYARVRALYEREGVSRNELDTARASAESTRASVTAGENRLRLAEQRLRYTRLQAPAKGAVNDVPVDLNENIRAGETVAVLETGDRLEVEVAIPESLIPQIQGGDAVRVVFDAFPEEPFQGSVRKVGVSPIGGGATFPVTVSLDAGAAQIRAGMAARVTFRFATGDTEQVFVPPSSIGSDAGGHYVYVVEPGPEGYGTTRRQPVEVGELGEDGIGVVEGLSGSELIVVAGVPRVREGLQVRILREGEWP